MDNNEFSTTFCINGCRLFNDEGNFSYWENKKTTSDEISVLSFLDSNMEINKNKILHVGIGNSFLAENIKNYNLFDGLTISQSEINHANKKKIKNYNVLFQNKFSKDNVIGKQFNNYDIIIDVNLKSFSCCNIAFNNLFKLYTKSLNIGGIIITGKKGMNWSRQVIPKWGFSFKNLFYKRLKEFDGPESNKLCDKDCFLLAEKHNLEFNNLNKDIVFFKK
tara:strand:- start:14 stop:673 length:660 start_codon:yes stop_codon:yes gene_type:complete